MHSFGLIFLEKGIIYAFITKNGFASTLKYGKLHRVICFILFLQKKLNASQDIIIIDVFEGRTIRNFLSFLLQVWVKIDIL